MTTATLPDLPRSGSRDATRRAPTPRAVASSSTLAWLRSHSFGLFDQVLISGSNFVTMVLAARALNPDSAAFGEFSLVYTAMLFVNILQSTLITQPHNVLASSRKGDDYNRYTAATAVCQLLMVIGLGALALLVAGFGYALGWHIAPLVLALAPAIVTWQIQEFVRRVLYTEGRLGSAFVNDVVSYGSQSIAVAALYFTSNLTGATAFYSLALTFALGSAFGLWQIRRSLGRHLDLSALIENWHFGKWLAGAEILQWCSSIHMYLYIAAVLIGAHASGELKTAQILYGPARIFAFFLCAVLPIRLAKSYHAGGTAALHDQFKSAILMIAPLMGAYCLFVAIFGNWLLHVLFNRTFEGSAALLALYSLATFLSYIELFVSAALSATRRTQTIFLGYVYGGVIAFVASWPIIAFVGINGAIWCMIVTAVTVNVMFWRTYRRKIAGNLTDAPVAAPAATAPANACAFSDTKPLAGSAEILSNLLALFDKNQVPYVLPHGYRDYPHNITSDVDCILPRWAVKGLPQLIRAHSRDLNADLVQWLDDASPLLVLSGLGADGKPTWLQLHVSTGFALSNLSFYSANEMLESRRQFNGLSVPAAHIEFACIVLNRAVKNSIKDKHAADLASLYLESPDACRAEIARFWDQTDSAFILDCVEHGKFDVLRETLPRLRAALLVRRFLQQPLRAIRGYIIESITRIRRFLRPSFGLHIVFLGPDGVGKSTVIEHVSQDVAPAFKKSGYQTFAPSILPRKLQPKKLLPHELPPRSLAASLLKASWWLVCYTIGYLFTVQTIRGRAGISICHRYLIDAIVDPKRYRYSGPIWILNAIWRIAPKPDLVILLDAPAEVIQQRKQEVPFEETARQRESFRAVVEPLEIGRIINATQPLEKTIADVNATICDFLRRRVSARICRAGQGGGT